MTDHAEVGGSAARRGPLFGAMATDWAQTWEGPDGWGTSVYGHVLGMWLGLRLASTPRWAVPAQAPPPSSPPTPVSTPPR